MNKEEVVRKIQGLLRLGDKRSNSSEAEAMAAIEAAKRLMARYQIFMAEVQTSQEEVELEKTVAVNNRFQPWQAMLSVAVANLCAVRSFVSCRLDRKKDIVFCGEKSDVSIALALYRTLEKTIRGRAQNVYGSGWDIEHRSYAIGFARELLARSKEMEGFERAEASRFSLVLKSKHRRIDEFLNLKIPALNRSITVRVDARQRGQCDGQACDIGMKNHLEAASQNAQPALPFGGNS